MSEDVYNTKDGIYDEGFTEDPGLKGWRIDNEMAKVYGLELYDEKSGFKSALYSRVVKDVNGFVLAVQYCYLIVGTDFDSGKDWLNDGKQALGLDSPQYEIANRNAKKLARGMTDGRDFTVAGHSLGGGLASLISLKLDVHGITFNAAGISEGTKKRFDIALDERAKVDAYVVNGEIVHCLQGKFGLLADGDMHVLPFKYLTGSGIPPRSINPYDKFIDRINFGNRVMNHTMGRVRRILISNGIN